MKPAAWSLIMALSLLAERAPAEEPLPTVAKPVSAGQAASAEEDHGMYALGALVWRGDPKGVSTAIAEGDPSTPGLFTMMLKLADGAWIPPHFHNVDKRLVVVKGTLLMGLGKVHNEATAEPLAIGGVAVVPKESWHHEGGRGETIVALIAEGPFKTTFAE